MVKPDAAADVRAHQVRTCSVSLRAVAQTVLDRGGDYVMGVFGNQPTLQEEIATIFADTKAVAETLSGSETVDVGHGRIE